MRRGHIVTWGLAPSKYGRVSAERLRLPTASPPFGCSSPRRSFHAKFRGMAVAFLGTGSGVPSLERNVTSIAIKLESRTIMVDCGEATQHQFMKCPGLTLQSVEHIFITHLHGDH
ncbi:ribonuclease z, putative, partial [Acanthamoeba castellanii str. Neff]